MTSIDIYKTLFREFNNYDYQLRNTFLFSWESDFFAISKSGYSIEVEVKISKSDFKADYNKTTFSGIKKHDYLLSEKNNKPNKFYFACPEGLIQPNEINDKYGLIWVKKYGTCNIVKNPKFLHKDKLLENKGILRKLMDKFYYRNIDLCKGMDLYQSEVKFGQLRIDRRYRY
jgi:hypothetical protein